MGSYMESMVLGLHQTNATEKEPMCVTIIPISSFADRFQNLGWETVAIKNEIGYWS